MNRHLKEAAYYKSEDSSLQCLLCPHRCRIMPDKTGACGVRVNKDGSLYSNNYGELTAISMDPIEKKPLYHFYPGSEIFSIGTFGCNLKCPFCQNWSISQNINASTTYMEPDALIEEALKYNSTGIAYTYSEPIVWFEYVRDVAQLARRAGLKNVMVTNGYICQDPLDELIDLIHAFNIDLKSFNPETYTKTLKGGLKEVLETIKKINESKSHLELTTLVVTGMNDNIKEMNDIIEFIADLNPDIPWHISRYYPQFRYNSKATDTGFIKEIYEKAKEKLKYVYCGNLPGDCFGSDTVCPSCGAILIERSGYHTSLKNLKGNKCLKCGFDTKIPV